MQNSNTRALRYEASAFDHSSNIKSTNRQVKLENFHVFLFLRFSFYEYFIGAMHFSDWSQRLEGNWRDRRTDIYWYLSINAVRLYLAAVCLFSNTTITKTRTSQTFRRSNSRKLYEKVGWLHRTSLITVIVSKCWKTFYCATQYFIKTAHNKSATIVTLTEALWC